MFVLLGGGGGGGGCCCCYFFFFFFGGGACFLFVCLCFVFLFLKFDLFNPLDELRLSRLGPLIKALNVLGISAID